MPPGVIGTFLINYMRYPLLETTLPLETDLIYYSKAFTFPSLAFPPFSQQEILDYSNKKNILFKFFLRSTLVKLFSSLSPPSPPPPLSPFLSSLFLSFSLTPALTRSVPPFFSSFFLSLTSASLFYHLWNSPEKLFEKITHGKRKTCKKLSRVSFFPSSKFKA